MLPFFLYLLRVSLSLALVFVLYRLVIQRLPRLSWNRAILVLGLVASFLLPFSQYTIQVDPPEGMAGWLAPDQTLPDGPAMVQAQPAESIVEPGVITSQASEQAEFNGWYVLFGVYVLGLIWKSIPWISGLWQVRRLTRDHARERYATYRLYQLPFAFAPCSHFGNIFVGSDFTELPQASQEAILAHEEAHVGLRHSWDMLLFELVQIVVWFHPLLPKYRESLQEVHEYQADAQATRERSKAEYARLLVSLSQRQADSRLGHGFARSLLKSRITFLLTSPDRPIWHYLTLALVFPLMVMTSCTQWTPEPTVVEVVSVPNTPPPPPPPISVEEDSSRFIPSIAPLTGEVTAGFGMAKHPITRKKRFHRGTDFRADIGTPVLATADGVVRKVPEPQPGGFGVHVYIQHGDRYETHYAHLKEVIVSEGDIVKRWDIIAYSGNSGLSTGPHLHYEVKDLKSTREETPFVNPEHFMALPEVEEVIHEHR